MKLSSRIKFSSVAFKLFILYFTSMSISIIVLGYLSYNKSAEIIKSSVSSAALQTVVQASRRLDLLFEEYANRSTLIFGYKDIQRGILGDFSDSYEQRNNTQRITTFLSNFVNVKNDTLNIHILGERKASYRYSNNGVAELPPVEQTYMYRQWYQEIKRADGKLIWFGIGPSFIPQINMTPDDKVFRIGRAIKNLDGRNEIIGVLLMEIDPSDVQRFLQEINDQTHGTTLLLDRSNAVAADVPGPDHLRPIGLDLSGRSEGTQNIVINGKQMVTVFAQSGINGWKMVGITPLAELLRDTGAIGLYTLYLAAGFMLVSVLVALIAARYMNKPVTSLLRAMRKAREGDFDSRIAEKRNDEFGVLFFGFNVMVERIKSLIDEVYVQKLLKKETQLKMMASQINAHFLYNTLDSIHWISRIYKADEISTMIFGLSRYLRISLNEGKELVTVKEVSELLESYLMIQKVRYDDKFTVRMEIDPSILKDKVLKYIFQPLVENAIYHGLEKKKEKGTLDIRWTKDGDLLVFQVKDDGPGIEPRLLSEIGEFLDSEEVHGDHHFALKNINSQIKLAYGRQYGLSIDSEPGRGTRVTVAVPSR